MADQPDVSPISLEVWEDLAAWARADEGRWDLLTLVDALTHTLQPIVDLVRDDDEFVGWARLMDVESTPDWALPWLAQFVGVVPLRGLDPESQRVRIRSAAGFHRGSPAAIVAAARQFLTGARTVELYERDGSAWRFRVRTYSAETPNPRDVFDAINALKPAGMVFVYEVQQGIAIDDLTGTIDQYVTETIESFSNTLPGDSGQPTGGLPYGEGVYGHGLYGYGSET